MHALYGRFYRYLLVCKYIITQLVTRSLCMTGIQSPATAEAIDVNIVHNLKWAGL